MHFYFWHPFDCLSCSKSLLFVVAFRCETPMFWLFYCLLCVCCACAYVIVCCVCVCMPWNAKNTHGSLHVVCMFCLLGVTLFFLKARANLWLLEQIESIRWLADLGLNRRLKFYLWPSFHALRALGTLVNVLANFLKRYPTNKIQAKKNLITPAAVMSAGQADFIQFIQQFLRSKTRLWMGDASK